MIQRIIVLAILIGVMFVIVHTEIIDRVNHVSPTLVLGFLLLAAYSTGFILEKVKLPKITGYIVAGLVFGPYVLSLTSKESIVDLSFINSLALAFIAFCAGGELKISSIRKHFKSIFSLVISQTIVVFVGVAALVFFLLDFMAIFTDIGFSNRIVISLIFGVISVARSPSSTIAIISETKAKGTYTDSVLSVTVVIDVVVILLFGIVLSFCQVIVAGNGSIDWTFVFILLIEILVAFITGVFLGQGIVYLIQHVRVEFPIVIIGIGFLVIKFSHLFSSYIQDHHNLSLNLEPLLICMSAGFTVQNFSKFGREFLVKMDRISLPIYVVFFAIIGASINMEVVKTAWIFGVILVCARLAMLYIASFLSGIVSGDNPLHYKHYWLGFITQAGVSLGLLTEIVRRFPTIGIPIQSLLISAITINQLIGPIAFKYALIRVGDANR